MEQKTTTISLQSKLVKSSVMSSVFAGLIALLLLLGISIYQTMSIQDEIMDEISDMLLVSDITSVSDHQLDELSDEFKVQYLLEFKKQALTESENVRQLKEYLSQNFIKEGYGFVWYKHKVWRTYAQYDDVDELKSYVIQPLNFRFKNLKDSLLIYLGVLILLWLIQWLFIHFTIKKQFKSFNLLSKQISSKGARDLEPIPHQPIEFLELKPMVQQLNQMLERLKYSLEAEQRFTADASHELRSPLSAIQMRLQVLARKYSTDVELQKQLSQIQNDVNRGTIVLENLLLLARLDPKKQEDLPKIKLPLLAIVEDVVLALEPFVQEKKINFHINLDESIQILVNQELLFTCLRNIIDNAIRYIQPMGEIEINAFLQGQEVELNIIDDGENITDDVITRLGERFYRALGTKTAGSGLGISICKKIIELHQGRIIFSRETNKGLKVTIYLPNLI